MPNGRKLSTVLKKQKTFSVMTSTKCIMIQSIKAETFDALIEMVKETKEKLNVVLDKVKAEETQYLVKEDLAKIFSVNPRTIENWTKQNLLKSYGMGGMIYYKKDEVLNAPVPIKR